ncbi:MAG: hypothetical protein K2K90_09675 [Lachnospiraceae bacterium]|nr:hypothetical protein [Lachnospiraceae bacterium]
MKKIRNGMKVPYISLFFVCICVLVCSFLYEKGKTIPDTDQDDILVVDEVSDKDMESPEDVEMEPNVIVEEMITELVRKRMWAVDFTYKEYPINKEIYTDEMDQEYKEVFLQVLLNQIPVQYEDGEETYFEDIDPVKEKLNADNITMIKEFFVYCYLDFDGDGFPELIVDPRGAYVRFGGPRIFKYDRDSKKVYVDGYRFMRYRPLCAGKFFYEHKGSPDSIQYGYQEIDSQSNVIEEVKFRLVYPADETPERYFITSVGEFEHVNVELDKESWDEMLHDFFEAKDNAIKGITFDELFSDIEHP